jgi:hypothetical protein
MKGGSASPPQPNNFVTSEVKYTPAPPPQPQPVPVYHDSNGNAMISGREYKFTELFVPRIKYIGVFSNINDANDLKFKDVYAAGGGTNSIRQLVKIITYDPTSPPELIPLRGGRKTIRKKKSTRRRKQSKRKKTTKKRRARA